jgi:hypothetical protein
MEQKELVKTATEADGALKANNFDKAEQIADALTRYNRLGGVGPQWRDRMAPRSL